MIPVSDELGIEMPSPHMSLYFGEASKPFAFSRRDADREELKAVIREVLEEKTRQEGTADLSRGASS